MLSKKHLRLRRSISKEDAFNIMNLLLQQFGDDITFKLVDKQGITADELDGLTFSAIHIGTVSIVSPVDSTPNDANDRVYFDGCKNGL